MRLVVSPHPLARLQPPPLRVSTISLARLFGVHARFLLEPIGMLAL